MARKEQRGLRSIWRRRRDRPVWPLQWIGEVGCGVGKRRCGGKVQPGGSCHGHGRIRRRCIQLVCQLEGDSPA